MLRARYWRVVGVVMCLGAGLAGCPELPEDLAAFEAFPVDGLVPLTVTFTATSPDAAAENAACAWDFPGWLE